MEAMKNQDEIFDYMGFGKLTTEKPSNKPNSYEVSESYVNIKEEEENE